MVRSIVAASLLIGYAAAFSCDECEANGYAVDGCGCGYCSSYGECVYTCGKSTSQAPLGPQCTKSDQDLSWDYRDLDHWNEPTDWECDLPGQSPINIEGAVEDASLGPLKMTNPSSNGWMGSQLGANEHTWEMMLPKQKEAFITWEGKDYYLAGFHYHSPSEHTINGRYYDMEAHHVHKADDGKALVLAVMMDASADTENHYMDKFWNDFPTDADTVVDHDHIGNPYTEFVPLDKSYYTYNGSFTTPPCTVDTVWVMIRTPVRISVRQRENFRKAMSVFPDNQMAVDKYMPYGVTQPWRPDLGNDNRPVQDIGDRVIRIGDFGHPGKVLAV